MTVTATLVEQGNNRLRYLISFSGEAPNGLKITTLGAASPDLLTDSLYGPLKQIANAFANGLGILPAGAFTTAQARAMWLADSSDTILGNNKVPRVLPRVCWRTGTTTWGIDADVDINGKPFVSVTATNGAAGGNSGTAYLDIETQGEIGL